MPTRRFSPKDLGAETLKLRRLGGLPTKEALEIMDESTPSGDQRYRNNSDRNCPNNTSATEHQKSP